MAFLTLPADMAAAYRPLIFRNLQTDAPTHRPAAQARVRVLIYGSEYARFTAVIDQQGNDIYTEVDVQRIIQEYLPPKAHQATASLFTVSYFLGGVVNNSDLVAEYQVGVRVQYLVDGLLEDDDVEEISIAKYAIPARRGHTEGISLSPYIDQAPAVFFLVGDTLFLTNQTGNRKVSVDDGFLISFMAKGVDAMHVRWYDENGSQIDQTRFYVDDDAATHGVITARVGPANLVNDVAYAKTPDFVGNPLPASFDNIAYYTIQLIQIDAFTDPTPRDALMSEPYRFDVVPCGGESIRLVWMNEFGMPDQYTFRGLINYSQDTGSSDVEFALPATYDNLHQSYFRGPAKIDIESDLYAEVTENVSYQDASWLRELISSPEVYLVAGDGTLQAVVISDTSLVTESSIAGTVEFSFKILLEREIVQRP